MMCLYSIVLPRPILVRAAIIGTIVGLASSGCGWHRPKDSKLVAAQAADLDKASSAGVCESNNRPMNPFRVGSAKARVFIFIRPDCPISNRYVPEIKRLNEAYGARGFAFWLVYPDRDTTVDDVAQHLKDFQVTLPALRDPQHALVKRAGATVTPEAAVFLADGREVYLGRIDDRYADFGKERAAPTRRDLDAVLSAIANGKPVQQTKTRAIGCYISEAAR